MLSPRVGRDEAAGTLVFVCVGSPLSRLETERVATSAVADDRGGLLWDQRVAVHYEVVPHVNHLVTFPYD